MKLCSYFQSSGVKYQDWGLPLLLPRFGCESMENPLSLCLTVSRVVVVQPWLSHSWISSLTRSDLSLSPCSFVLQLTVQSLYFLAHHHHLLALTDKLPPLWQGVWDPGHPDRATFKVAQKKPPGHKAGNSQNNPGVVWSLLPPSCWDSCPRLDVISGTPPAACLCVELWLPWNFSLGWILCWGFQRCRAECSRESSLCT